MKTPYYQYYVLIEGMHHYHKSGDLTRFYDVDSFLDGLFGLYLTKRISKLENLVDHCRASLRFSIDGFAGLSKEACLREADDNLKKIRCEMQKKGYALLV